MNTAENTRENVKPKISLAVKISLGLTFLSFLCVINIKHAEGLFILAMICFLPLSMILSLAGLVQIKRSAGRFKGMPLVIGTIVFQLAMWIPSFHFVYTEFVVSRITCNCHMIYLRKAMKGYAEENEGKYPPPDKWCDLLYENTEGAEKIFCKTPGGSQGGALCHYAFNPRCKQDSPEGTVLFFEVKGGWNESGGSDLLTSENNYKRGWRVITNGGRVEFIEPHELDKLQW